MMAKSSYQIEQELIQNLEKMSGQSLSKWMEIIPSSGRRKKSDIVNWLKVHHSFKHIDASLLVGIFLNGGQHVYSKNEILISSKKQTKIK